MLGKEPLGQGSGFCCACRLLGGCLVQPGSAAGCWAAAAIPPRQGKLAVTHHPCWPCLLGDSSRTLSRGSHQHLHPPQSSGRGLRSCGALGGFWQGRLPAVGDVPWAWGWRDPMPRGKGCTVINLLSCPGLVVPDPGEGQEKVILHPFHPPLPLLPPAPGAICTQPLPQGPFILLLPASARAGRGGALLGLPLSPEQCLELSRTLRSQHLTWPPQGSQGCAYPRGRMQAVCACIQGGQKVTSGCVQVVSPHFGKGTLGRVGQVVMGQQAGSGEATSFGNLPRRFRRG